MLYPSWAAHCRRHIDDCGNGAQSGGLGKALHIVDSVLAAQHERFRSQVRREQTGGFLGVERFDAEEHDLRPLRRVYLGGGRDRNVLLKVRRLEE